MLSLEKFNPFNTRSLQNVNFMVPRMSLSIGVTCVFDASCAIGCCGQPLTIVLLLERERRFVTLGTLVVNGAVEFLQSLARLQCGFHQTLFVEPDTHGVVQAGTGNVFNFRPRHASFRRRVSMFFRLFLCSFQCRTQLRRIGCRFGGLRPHLDGLDVVGQTPDIPNLRSNRFQCRLQLIEFGGVFDARLTDFFFDEALLFRGGLVRGAAREVREGGGGGRWRPTETQQSGV